MKNLVGRVYGRLTVLSRKYRDKKYNWYWECQCSCGNKTLIHTKHLNDTANGTKSCGCLFKDYQDRRRINKKPKQPYDGDKIDQFYRTRNSYKAMIRRCYDPKFLSYMKYGGKGIIVCDRWRIGEDGLSGWRCFLKDMGERPEKHTLDRKENSIGYTPSNCRWATQEQQSANQRRGKLSNITT